MGVLIPHGVGFFGVTIWGCFLPHFGGEGIWGCNLPCILGGSYSPPVFWGVLIPPVLVFWGGEEDLGVLIPCGFFGVRISGGILSPHFLG